MRDRNEPSLWEVCAHSAINRIADKNLWSVACTYQRSTLPVMIHQPRRHLARSYSGFVPIFNDFSPKICGKSRAFRADPKRKDANTISRLGDAREPQCCQEYSRTGANLSCGSIRTGRNFTTCADRAQWHAKRAALTARLRMPEHSCSDRNRRGSRVDRSSLVFSKGLWNG